MEILVVAAQTFAIYVFLVIALSRFGRSLMAGLTPYEYLIAALLGSAVETGMYHGSASLAAGLTSAATLILANHATCALLKRCPRLRRWLAGRPVVLVHNGEILPDNQRRVRLTEADVRAAVRKRGYDDLDCVRLAVIEQNGDIGVVPREAPAA